MSQDDFHKHLVGDLGQKALIVKDGKVLICRNVGWDEWDFPGGRLHIKEDLKEGLMRELKEELGVEAEIGEPFFITVGYGAPSGMPRIFVLYCVSLTDREAPFVLEKDEIAEVKWIGKDDIEGIKMIPELKPALYKFFAKS